MLLKNLIFQGKKRFIFGENEIGECFFTAFKKQTKPLYTLQVKTNIDLRTLYYKIKSILTLN